MNLEYILYIVLILFTSIIWVLLSLVLYRLLKILDTLTEMVELYTIAKWYLTSKVPEVVLGVVKSFLIK